LLRKSHAKGDELHNLIYNYVTKEGKLPDRVPEPLAILEGANRIKAAKSEKEVVDLVEKYELPHELVPKEYGNSTAVWRALLPNMPMTATLRTLNRLTSYGVIKPLSSELKTVVGRLTDAEQVKKARIHPIAVLAAIKTYSQGRGIKGSLTWSPIQQVVDALDEMLYMAFDAVEPTGKNIMLALDISGSMGMGGIGGLDFVTPREGTAVMSLATARSEKNYHVVGFSNELIPLNISPRQRMDGVLKTISGLPFGSTDCALPMVYALKNRLDVDAFFVYTDNETWAGNIKPVEALRQYRNERNPQAKLVVCGMTGTPFTIADPNDAGMLDVVGFDSSAPAIMSDFIRKPFRSK
jgi:60 kDa SS-A/Ro ribonucleoprotein